MSHIQVVQEIGMTGMLRTGIGGRFIQYFAPEYYRESIQAEYTPRIALFRDFLAILFDLHKLLVA